MAPLFASGLFGLMAGALVFGPGLLAAIDHSGLQAAIAHADQVIRDSRRSLWGLAPGGLPAPPAGAATIATPAR